MSEVDDRKAAIRAEAIKWAEGDGFALVGDRFEFSELNVYRFVGDPRDILVDAYLALLSLTPTQPDREQIEAAVRAVTDGWISPESDAEIVNAVMALFNGGTNVD